MWELDAATELVRGLYLRMPRGHHMKAQLQTATEKLQAYRAVLSAPAGSAFL